MIIVRMVHLTSLLLLNYLQMTLVLQYVNCRHRQLAPALNAAEIAHTQEHSYAIISKWDPMDCHRSGHKTKVMMGTSEHSAHIRSVTGELSVNFTHRSLRNILNRRTGMFIKGISNRTSTAFLLEFPWS